MQIDYYGSATSPNPSATCELNDFLDSVKSDEFAPQVLDIRRHLAEGNKLEAENLKRLLPCLSLSAKVSGRRKNAMQDHRMVHSGLLQLDIDLKDNPSTTIDEIKEKLKEDAHVVAFFDSPSGNGVKGIARIPANPQGHKDAFLSAEKHYAALGIVIDQSCKDPIRLCFVSHDPNLWRRDFNAVLPLPVTVTPVVSQTLLVAPQSDITLADLAEMIAVIPRQNYANWLQICSGAWNHFGEAATPILQSHWGEERAGEYAEKFAQRLEKFTIGTVWMFATQNGWSPSKTLKSKKVTPQEPEPLETETSFFTDLSDFEEPAPISFGAEDIFYDAPSGKYLVKNGKNFTVFGRKSPVATGVSRQIADQFSDPLLLRAEVSRIISNRELDGCVEWYGVIAGKRKGLSKDHDGRAILITSEAVLPVPAAGDYDIIQSILFQAFPDPQSLIVFISWLSTRYNCVRKNCHIPAPMLVVAGEVNSGKSLLAWIVSQMLGGRTANPYSSWSGGVLWNDDIIGSELLLIDDCVGTTDIRSRRSFGASFKEAIYPHIVQLRKRNVSAISVRPVWAVMVCCNNTPEAMQVIPPLDNDLSDKIIILHCESVKLTYDTSTPEARVAFQKIIATELPQFAQELVDWVIPADLKDSRSGVAAWRDPELSSSLDMHSPSNRLLDLIASSMWADLPKEFSALDIESRLTDIGSPVREQARQLFTWSGACGSALSKLCKIENSGVTLSGVDRKNKTNKYWISVIS